MTSKDMIEYHWNIKIDSSFPTSFSIIFVTLKWMKTLEFKTEFPYILLTFSMYFNRTIDFIFQ